MGKYNATLKIETTINFDLLSDGKENAIQEIESMELEELFEAINFPAINKQKLAELTSIKVGAIRELSNKEIQDDINREQQWHTGLKIHNPGLGSKPKNSSLSRFIREEKL